jgi:hypothetical protein
MPDLTPTELDLSISALEKLVKDAKAVQAGGSNR